MTDPTYSRAQADREHDEELAAECVRGYLLENFEADLPVLLDDALTEARFDAGFHFPDVECTGLLDATDAEAALLELLQARNTERGSSR